jgi:hypothetical protein
METVEKYITGNSLKDRRPDLYNKLKLDCDNINKEKLYLEIVNDIMLENLEHKFGSNILKTIATAKYPFNLPANFPLIAIRAYLKEHNVSLIDIYKAFNLNVDTTLEKLNLSLEAYQLITSTNISEYYLKEVYGINKKDELKDVDKFIAQTDIDHSQLQPLLDTYNKFAYSEKLSITNKTINLNDKALGFLHRFIRLANKLNCSFDELGETISIIGKKEIDADCIEQIAKIKNLKDRFKQPLNKIAELYSQDEVLSKRFESHLTNQSKLQNILDISSNELTLLIDNSKNITSKKLSKVYKQVLLARLINVSIMQLKELLTLLNTDALDIEGIIGLNDWLNSNSITAEQINRLINFSYEEAKKIQAEIKQDDIKQEEVLYNTINKYIKIQPDLFTAVDKFTKEYHKYSVDALIRNATIFTELKVTAEDVTNLTNNDYNLGSIWSLKQIKILVNYIKLKDTFHGNAITLPQYVDSMKGKNDQDIEKIVQLTNWNKATLESIKSFFTKDPIKSLLKIKSIIDISDRLGVNIKVLLDIKDLYGLKSDDWWTKYNNVLNNLELSTKSETKKNAIKYIMEQKRNILAKYMRYKLKLRNMRELYSYLLIDIEMGSCSKISPLKAALNSIQLYIHRCMMKLEKGITVEKGLNEEKWKWLSSYREWEASNKIKLYPENYLNPTLRRITTPGYKMIQSTLMQGNITDDVASDAYMKYFEEFEQAASLKIVDSCFESVEDRISGVEENTLYIIGRTLAKPYYYYYRTAVFNKENEKILYWTAWEKIGALIPVETVTPIYAFNRLFIFWVQQIEKKEMNVNKDSNKINQTLPLSDTPEVTINYIFQKPSGIWSAQQELISNVKITPAREVTKLYWKKVAAFYLIEEGGEERRIVITIGKDRLVFTLDEDMVSDKDKQGLFFDDSYNVNLHDSTSNLSCDIDKSEQGKLNLKFTKNVFKSNVTNKEDNAVFVTTKPEIKLLGKFKQSLTQQVVNKPGWFIVEGNLDKENVRESFLLIPRFFNLASISSQSTYKVGKDKLEFKYYSEIPRINLDNIEFTFIRLNITGNIRKLRNKAYIGGPKRILSLDSQMIEQLKFGRFVPKDRVIDHPLLII